LKYYLLKNLRVNPAEDYILHQEDPYREILLFLQQFIERQIPFIQLKFKYKIPFFEYKDRPFCILNVSRKKTYVELGFWHAAHLILHPEHLHSDGRKVMWSLRFSSLEAIDPQVLEDLLQEAVSKSHLGYSKQ
jgi:hypothetical protein